MIVKGTAGQIQQQVKAQTQAQREAQSAQTVVPKTEDEVKAITSNDADKIESTEKQEVSEGDAEAISTGSFYKSGKDGKILIRKSSQDGVKNEDGDDDSNDTDRSDEKKYSKDRDKIKSKSSKSTSSKNKTREKDEKRHEKDNDNGKEKDREKERDKRKSSSSSSKSSSSSSKYKSSSSSSKSREDRDKDRHRDKDKGKGRDRDKSKDNDKDKHRSNGGLKSSSSSSKSNKDKKDYRDKEKTKHDEKDKEKQADKDNSTLEKLKPPTIDKLGRIPKKTPLTEETSLDNNALDLKRKSFSVGIRKDKENEERPKTVKVFNSKMRSTGLEEEVKPAPSRSTVTTKKPTPSVQLPTIPQKRPSPPKDIRESSIVPPEKKLKMDKIDAPERPGSIKLIPPKPKREFLKSYIYLFVFYFYRNHRKAGGSFQPPYNMQGSVALPSADGLHSYNGKQQSFIYGFLFYLLLTRYFFYYSFNTHVKKYTRSFYSSNSFFVFVNPCVFFDISALLYFIYCANC